MGILKGVCIFASGALCGGTASYLYYRKKYEKKKAEIAELKDHWVQKIEKEADLKENEAILKREGYISYDNLGDKEVKDIIRNVSEKAIKEDRPMEGYPGEPIVIEEEEYSGGELYFEKIELDYYLDDGALVDEADELQLVEDTVGYDILDSFIANDEEDIIYVRNAEKETDYQIRKTSGKFSDILGIGGDEED